MSRPPDTPIDYGLAADEYAAHRQGFPPEFFRRLTPLRIGLPAQRMLDLGTGTGLLAREFARRGCLVTGIDISPPLLALAESANIGEVVRPTYLLGRAEATGLPDCSFDVVAAGTTWHLFHRQAAAKEARRLLRPGGRLLIAHLDWHTAPGTVGAATLRLLERYGPGEAAPSSFQFPAWAYELTVAGFAHWDLFGFTAALDYTPLAWRGRVKASHRVKPVMDTAALATFDAALARVLARHFAGEVLRVEHRVFGLVAK